MPSQCKGGFPACLKDILVCNTRSSFVLGKIMHANKHLFLAKFRMQFIYNFLNISKVNQK